jgi:hypothetical protein
MKRKGDWLELVPYLAALVSCAPLIAGGFPLGHDWTFELARVAEFGHALKEGQFPPHWAPNLYGGYGSPVFLFYAPAFSALANAGALIAKTPAWGASLVLVLFSFLGVFSVRRLFAAIPGVDPQGGRIAATLFALNPYLIGDKLLRNANAEFIALCVLPFALLGLVRIGRQPLWGAFVIAGALAASLLSHNLTSLVCLALLVVGTLWLYGLRGSVQIQLHWAVGVAIGLLVAAFVWLPALTLREWVHLDELTQGKFNFHNQWKSVGELFSYSQFFSAGLLTPIAFAFGAFAFIRHSGTEMPGRRLLAGMLAAALIFASLQFSVSSFVWESIPWLRFMQFPWRFMGPLALVTSVAAGIAASRLLTDASGRMRLVAELCVLAICIANAWPQLARYEPLPPMLQRTIQKAVQPGKLRRGPLNVSVLDEYLPVGANREIWKREARAGGRTVIMNQPEAEIEVLEERGSRMMLRVDAPSGSRLRVARWYFPGWRARLDGIPIPIESNPMGGIDLEVAAPGGLLELAHHPPRSRQVGLALSGLGAGLWLFLLVTCYRKQRSP